MPYLLVGREDGHRHPAPHQQAGWGFWQHWWPERVAQQAVGKAAAVVAGACCTAALAVQKAG